VSAAPKNRATFLMVLAARADHVLLHFLHFCEPFRTHVLTEGVEYVLVLVEPVVDVVVDL
jgi:hypothetical protein